MSRPSSLLHRCGIKSLAHAVALLAAVAVAAALLPAADASALSPHAEDPRPASSPATPDDTSAPPRAPAQTTHAQPMPTTQADTGGTAPNTTAPPPTPTAASNAVTAGGYHTCGLKTDNTIACWGRNSEGQADAPSGTFKAVTAGAFYTCGLKTDNTITCWGHNGDGQADAPNGTFNAVTAGWYHTCGLKTDNTIACWGYHGDYSGRADAPNGTFNAVTAGWAHTCGLKTDNTITCWGNNEHGQADAPNGTFNAVTAGWYHTCGLKTDNTITCWGNNESGEADAPNGTFNAVTAGWYHTCGLKTDNTITCWGHNSHGRADAPNGTFNAVTAGTHHTCGLKTDNTIACWGHNGAGQTDAPNGTFGPAGGGGATVTVTKGGPGPTELGPGQGVACGANTPTCRLLDIELRGFAAGTYTVSCSHDGWENEAPLTWWTFSVTVDAGGSASRSGPCFINFAKLTGNGVYVTVSRTGTATVTSNWLEAAGGSGPAVTVAKGNPTAPTIVLAKPGGHDRVWVGWSAPSDTGGSRIDRYELQYSSPEWTSNIIPVSIWLRLHQKVNLSAGVTYTVAVRAVNRDGRRSPFATATVTTISVVSEPGRPTNLKATETDHDRVRVTWDPPSDNGGSPIERYEVQYTRAKDPDNPLHGDKPEWQSPIIRRSSRSHTQKLTYHGITYQVEVRAVNRAGKTSRFTSTSATRDFRCSLSSKLDKYEIKKEERFLQRDLHRVYALRSFRTIDGTRISVGDKGGLVNGDKKIPSLSQTGCSWVFENAKIEDEATLKGNALLKDNARIANSAAVSGNAIVEDHGEVLNGAKVYGNALVSGKADVKGDGARVYGDAEIFGEGQVYDYARVYGNASVSGEGRVFDYAMVHGNASVSGESEVYGHAEVSGYSKIYGDADIKGNSKVSGDKSYLSGKYVEVWGKDTTVSGDAKLSGEAHVWGKAHVSGETVVKEKARILGDIMITGDDTYDGKREIDRAAKETYDDLVTHVASQFLTCDGWRGLYGTHHLPGSDEDAARKFAGWIITNNPPVGISLDAGQTKCRNQKVLGAIIDHFSEPDNLVLDFVLTVAGSLSLGVYAGALIKALAAAKELKDIKDAGDFLEEQLETVRKAQP